MSRMIPILAAIALGLSTPLAASADASGEMALARRFADICLASHGDARAAITAAGAAGWAEDPERTKAARTSRKGETDLLQVFRRDDGGGYSLLILRERNTRPRHRRPLMQCMVTLAPGDDPASAAAAVIGGPPVGRDNGDSIWMLDGSVQTPTPLGGDEVDRARKLAAADQAVIIHAGQENGAAVISYEGPSR